MGYDLITHNPTDDYTHVESGDSFVAMLENCDCARWNTNAWPMLLDLARSYGWEPLGTVDPSIPSNDPEKIAKALEEWNGGYMTNEGQAVTAQDALNLAAALERALDDIPDHYDLSAKMIRIFPGDPHPPRTSGVASILDELGNDSGFSMRVPNTNLSSFEYFGGREKHLVIDFITLCRKGSFSMW